MDGDVVRISAPNPPAASRIGRHPNASKETPVTRSAFALAAAFALLVPAGSARAGADFMRDDGTIKYRFYTDWELLYVERDRTPDVEVSFFSRVPDPAFREALSTDAVVDDDEEFGGRGVIGFRLDERSAIEAVFMGWGHERSAHVSGGADYFAFEYPDLDNMGVGTPVLGDNGFDFALAHDLDYDEDFYNGELNYRHRLEVDGADYSFNLLAGIRAIRLEEDLDFKSIDGIPFGEIGTYNIATRNTLIGGQLGVEGLVPLWGDRLELDLYLAGGGYANQATVYSDYFDSLSGDTARQSQTEWDPAGVFETAAHFTIRVYRGVQIKAGYRAVYLVNIAAAPDQFARSGSYGDFFENSFENDGATIFHGPSLGVTVDF
jgi:hypothetical protein